MTKLQSEAAEPDRDAAPDLTAGLAQLLDEKVLGLSGPAAELRERALLATRVAFTITDPRQPGNPLVWVNPAFTETTGYALEESVGRNCRFLQGPQTDHRAIDEIRDAVARQEAVTTTLLNYRKDGSTFFNELSVAPVFDELGDLTHYVGVQSDVSSRVYAERNRDAAVVRAESASLRLTLLASFMRELAATMDVSGLVELLARFTVPRLATWCLVTTADSRGRLGRPSIFHQAASSDTEIAELVGLLQDALTSEYPEHGLIRQVVDGLVPYLILEDVEPESLDFMGIRELGHQALFRRLGVSSLLVVPLTARNHVVGALCLVADEDRRPYTEDDLRLAEDLAARTALMIENSQLYAGEREAVEVMQRGLLPPLPELEGFSCAVEYVTADHRMGGSWSDVFPLSDGLVGVVVGRVTGDDGRGSVGGMSEIRAMVRAYAWTGLDAADVLHAVGDAAAGLGLSDDVVCLFGRLRLPGASYMIDAAGQTVAAAGSFDYASFGSEAAGIGPSLVHPDGRCERLATSSADPADLDDDEPLSSQLVGVRSGDVLLLGTPGVLDAVDVVDVPDSGLTPHAVARTASQSARAAGHGDEAALVLRLH